MVHDQHVFTHGIYLPFCFLCPAQSLLCVYPVWVHSRCGLEVLLIFFPALRCRNLALNRVFSYFLVVGMFLYLGGVFAHPPCSYAPICLYAPIHLYAPKGVHTPINPHALLCTCMVLEHLHVVGVVICLNLFWDSSLTPPYLGVPPP